MSTSETESLSSDIIENSPYPDPVKEPELDPTNAEEFWKGSKAMGIVFIMVDDSSKEFDSKDVLNVFKKLGSLIPVKIGRPLLQRVLGLYPLGFDLPEVVPEGKKQRTGWFLCRAWNHEKRSADWKRAKDAMTTPLTDDKPKIHDFTVVTFSDNPDPPKDEPWKKKAPKE